MPVVEKVDDAVDITEGQIFNNPTSMTLTDIFQLKRSELHLRWGPHREVLNKLARDDYSVLDERGRVYIRDAYDHLVHLHNITNLWARLRGRMR